MSYTFKSRAWLAVDTTWYGGGQTTIDGAQPPARENGTRLGGTFALPLPHRQSLKFAASTGASVRADANFDTYVVAWQIAWFDRSSKRPQSATRPHGGAWPPAQGQA